MQKRRWILIVPVLLLIGTIGIPGQTMVLADNTADGFVPRGNYHACLELPDQVLHGAGQDPAAFLKYYGITGSRGVAPLVYMDYVNLKDDMNSFFAKLESNMSYYLEHDQVYLVPQISLGMTTDGHPETHYEQDVAAGLYDHQIEAFCHQLARLGHPALIRIGFEFNGTSWNGYEAKTYKPAFIRIVKAIRAHHLEAATIWCAALPLQKYLDFYPGDEYVDWWGIDLFFASEVKSAETLHFLKNAELHGKPVIIGESTPRSIGVGGGQKSWDRWFKPYFNLIRTNRVIKAFCYINWDWANYPQWSDWGDARLETEPVVAEAYCNEMKLPLYFHGTRETDLRRHMTGITDNTPPSRVTGLTTGWSDNGRAINLTWLGANDDHGINRYEVFADGKRIGSSVEQQFQSTDIRAGNSIGYTVRAVDSAGNAGPFSSPIQVKVPGAIAKIANGDFERGMSSWSLRNSMNAMGIWEGIDQPRAGDGRWAKIYIKHGTGTNWHIQFGQGFQSHRGYAYRVQFTVRADAPAVIDLFLQQAHAPYASILERTNIIIGPEEQTLVFQNTVPADEDNLFLSFMMGHADQRTIWIKNISLTEIRQ